MRASEVFDYGNSLRAGGAARGVRARIRLPRVRSCLPTAAVLRGSRPVPMGGAVRRSRRHRRDRQAVLEEFPDDEPLDRWIRAAAEKITFQGLPARICWLGYGERARLGLRFNGMVASGELRAPIVIGRGHLDSGAVASPDRETETMADGSDAIADWPLLTPSSTPRPRRHGCRSITVAASGSDAGSAPGWCSSLTARSSPRRSSSAC